MTNLYWLRISIRICGGRKQLAELCCFDPGRITEWLNETRKISLKNAIKIEYATHGKVTRDRLVSESDKKFKNKLKTEVEIIQRSKPPVTFKERVELGLANEATIGSRKGVRTDLLLGENFPKVYFNSDPSLGKKSILQGRTEQIAAEIAGFSNYKTYQQAKKIVKEGTPELIKAVEEGLPILRAFKICGFPPEKQRYFLGLDRSVMIQELYEACLQNARNKWVKICSPGACTKNDAETNEADAYEPLAAWALLSFGTSGIFKKKRKNHPEEERKLENVNVSKLSI